MARSKRFTGSHLLLIVLCDTPPGINPSGFFGHPLMVSIDTFSDAALK
jgi:hypothetical protein